MTGETLGPYRVLEKIGEGGMGEVYRARDGKLERDVAIKILPAALAGDPDRIARFEREAKTLAALNHPNIAHIHGLEESSGIRALVMELVEGPTLADRIAQGPIPLEEALPIARQIAEALEAAHDQGIIHRDLKPANVKVRPDGTVKVLDFGLAKALAGDSASVASAAALTNSPTLASPAMTRVGTILGTAAYMAPEQAKGREVGKRADVWAFGAVLYEMLTGRRAFQGDDVTDTLAAILRAEPDWSALPAGTPAAIRRLLRRTLEKDPRSRLSDMAMVRLELRDAASEPTLVAVDPSVMSRPQTARWRVATSVAIVLATLVSGLAVWILRRPAAEAPRPVARFSIDLPPETSLSAPGRTQVALSPDGTRMVFAANQALFLRSLDQVDAAPISGTLPPAPGILAAAPGFSPDGRWIVFYQGNQLLKVPVGGGTPVKICDLDFPPVGVSWEADGRMLMGAGGMGILSVASTGGTPEVVAAATNGERVSSPRMLPGSKWLMFVVHPSNTNMDQGEIVVQSAATGERRVLVEGVRDAWYTESGHLVYGRGNALLAQAFDAKGISLVGGPVPILDGVANGLNQSPAMHVAISSTGTLLYVPGTAASGTASTRLVRVARDGKPSPIADIAGMTWFPRFSPDGARLAYGVSNNADLNDTSDLWVLDIARGARTRVTFSANNRFYPIWTRDGTRLTFADGTGPRNRLLTALADGSGGVQVLMDTNIRRFPTSWSPDGNVLAFYLGGAPPGGRDIGMLRKDGDKWTAEGFVETPFEERGAVFSPSGRWVAYVSNKAGQNDIYARPYPGPGREVTISVGGGQEPVWGPTGRELFYRQKGKLLAVPLDETPSGLTVGAPTRVFDDPYRLDTGGAAGGMANYDIAADGKSFVMIEEQVAKSSPPVRLQVVLNWHEELKARAPLKSRD